jgi:hypothetical protein
MVVPALCGSCCFADRLLKNARLLKFPSSFAVQRTQKYASRLRIGYASLHDSANSGALHPDIFEQPVSAYFQQATEAAVVIFLDTVVA